MSTAVALSHPACFCMWCGDKHMDPPFASQNWREVRLDIDSKLTRCDRHMANMKAVDDASVDAVFSSHNISIFTLMKFLLPWLSSIVCSGLMDLFC